MLVAGAAVSGGFVPPPTVCGNSRRSEGGYRSNFFSFGLANNSSCARASAARVVCVSLLTNNPSDQAP
jgi:hypothetical protein